MRWIVVHCLLLLHPNSMHLTTTPSDLTTPPNAFTTLIDISLVCEKPSPKHPFHIDSILV